jgi:hypothetical protein
MKVDRSIQNHPGRPRRSTMKVDRSIQNHPGRPRRSTMKVDRRIFFLGVVISIV